MAHLKRDRRGHRRAPSPSSPSSESAGARLYVVRLDERGYYSRESPWRPVPRSKATWFDRGAAERIRHACAKPAMGFREATIESRNSEDTVR